MSVKSLVELILALSVFALFGLFASNVGLGGHRGALSWIILLGVLPWIALAAGLVTFIIRRGKWSDLLFVHIFAMLPLVVTIGLLPMAYPGAPDDETISLRLPFSDPVIVAQGGRSAFRNHHATIPAQRWAYDLVVPPLVLNGTSLADHGCWGVPILAPAEGNVVSASDRFPDTPIGQPRPDGVPPEGNALALRLNDGTFVILAHLQMDSIIVEIGDSVDVGDRLAACGNSGSSDAPHLHIHRQREHPDAGLGEIATGLPFDFRQHGGPPRPEGLGRFDPETLAAAPVFQHVDPAGRD